MITALLMFYFFLDIFNDRCYLCEFLKLQFFNKFC